MTRKAPPSPIANPASPMAWPRRGLLPIATYRYRTQPAPRLGPRRGLLSTATQPKKRLRDVKTAAGHST